MAVVTGASKGIGASIAKHLVAEGVAVVVNYAASKEGADRVVSEIANSGSKAIAVQANVAKKVEIERLFTEAEKAFGRLDILVNNAAIIEFRPLEGITEECFYKQFNVNLLGPIFATQSAVKHPRPEEGSVVNISSGAAIGPQPGGSSVYRGSREHRARVAVFLASSDSA